MWRRPCGVGYRIVRSIDFPRRKSSWAWASCFTSETPPSWGLNNFLWAFTATYPAVYYCAAQTDGVKRLVFTRAW
jgi:hypothetical protein